MAKAGQKLFGCLVWSALLIGGCVVGIEYITKRPGVTQKADLHTPETETTAKRESYVAPKQIPRLPNPLIDKAIQANAISKIKHGGGLVYVTIQPVFYGLQFEQKDTLCAAIFDEYLDRKNVGNHVVLFDGNSGKEVGRYTTHSGMEMY